MKKIIDFGFDIENSIHHDTFLNFIGKFMITCLMLSIIKNCFYLHIDFLSLVVPISVFFIVSYYLFRSKDYKKQFMFSVNLLIFLIPLVVVLMFDYKAYHIIYLSSCPLLILITNGLKVGLRLVIVFVVVVLLTIFNDFTKGIVSLETVLVSTLVFFLISYVSYNIEILNKTNLNKIQKNLKEIKSLNKELEYISHRDELTGLYNRYFLHSHILKNQDFLGKSFFFCMGDIDNFKKYNDNYGHQKGDIVLKEFSNILQNSFGKIDNSFLVRMGGEEFGIFIFLIDDAKEIVNDFFEQLWEANIEHQYNADYGRCTMSMGATYYTLEKDLNFPPLYDKVDKALYQAKEEGRNRIIFV